MVNTGTHCQYLSVCRETFSSLPLFTYVFHATQWKFIIPLITTDCSSSQRRWRSNEEVEIWCEMMRDWGRTKMKEREGRWLCGLRWYCLWREKRGSYREIKKEGRDKNECFSLSFVLFYFPFLFSCISVMHIHLVHTFSSVWELMKSYSLK